MKLLIAVCLLLPCVAQPPAFRLERVAGVRADAKEAMNGQDALLSIPYGIAVDADGSVYFHDRNHYVIRRLGPDGVLTRVAGNGEVGSGGDGGPAIEAQLNYDIGSMAFGPDGALYFADGWNCTVRRVTRAGVIERVAGMAGQCGYSGDGSPATSARLGVLGTVSFDAMGRLYIGDGFNHRIRRVRLDGVIETFAGTGTPGFSGDDRPASEAQLNICGAQADAAGNVWIMDAGNFRIRRVNAAGIITTVAGTGVPGLPPDDGPALSSSIGFVTYGKSHPNGGFYFFDMGRFAMFAVTPEGRIRRVVGTGRPGDSGDGGPGTSASVTTAADLATAPDGSVVFSDQLNNVIRRLTTGGLVETIAGRRRFDGNYGTAWEQALNGPAAVAWDPMGGYYVYERFGARIRRVDPDGTMITVAGTGQHGTGGDGGPARRARVGMTADPASAALAVDSQRRVYLVDGEHPWVRRFTPGERAETVAGTGAAGFSGDGGPAAQARVNRPSGIALARDGRVFVADTGNHRIRVIDASGVIRTIAGTGTAGFVGDGGPAAQARLNAPGAIAFDAQDNLYFIDGGNNRIRRISADGVITTIAGRGTPGPLADGPALEVPLANLRSLAVLPEGGILFVETSAFPPASRLRYLGTDRRIVSLNSPATGYRGDGGSLGRAAFSSIQQISVSPWGEVLIADRDNHVVRWMYRE